MRFKWSFLIAWTAKNSELKKKEKKKKDQSYTHVNRMCEGYNVVLVGCLLACLCLKPKFGALLWNKTGLSLFIRLF